MAAVPTTSPIPGAFGAGGYADADLAAKTAYQNALAQINQNRSSTLRQYGYLGDIDPTSGTLTNMRVDPNNPYGSFQSMLATHATAQNAAEANAQQRGLGHGGLAAQGVTADHRSFGADSANLGESLMSELEGLQSAQTGAQQTMNDTLYQDQLNAARDAILNQMFNPADFSGIDDPGYHNKLGNNTNPKDSPGSLTVFQKALAARGAPTTGLDPGIAAAILSKPPKAPTKKKVASGGGGGKAVPN